MATLPPKQIRLVRYLWIRLARFNGPLLRMWEYGLANWRTRQRTSLHLIQRLLHVFGNWVNYLFPLKIYREWSEMPNVSHAVIRFVNRGKIVNDLARHSRIGVHLIPVYQRIRLVKVVNQPSPCWRIRLCVSMDGMLRSLDRVHIGCVSQRYWN